MAIVGANLLPNSKAKKRAEGSLNTTLGTSGPKVWIHPPVPPRPRTSHKKKKTHLRPGRQAENHPPHERNPVTPRFNNRQAPHFPFLQPQPREQNGTRHRPRGRLCSKIENRNEIPGQEAKHRKNLVVHGDTQGRRDTTTQPAPCIPRIRPRHRSPTFLPATHQLDPSGRESPTAPPIRPSGSGKRGLPMAKGRLHSPSQTLTFAPLSPPSLTHSFLLSVLLFVLLCLDHRHLNRGSTRELRHTQAWGKPWAWIVVPKEGMFTHMKINVAVRMRNIHVRNE